MVTQCGSIRHFIIHQCKKRSYIGWNYSYQNIGCTWVKVLGNRRRRSKRCYCSSSLDDSGDFSSDQADYVISSRRNLQRAFPIQSFRVAGVTFEDRQLLVSGLQPGNAVLFEKEPENPIDPQAVAVKLLDGKKLGYIPKEETKFFPHSICIGKVRSVGQNQENGNWGCYLNSQPQLPPFIPISIPGDLMESCASLVESLEKSDASSWDAIKKSTLEMANGTCSVSGAKTNHVEARWALSVGLQQVRLARFTAQHPLVSSIQYFQTWNDSLYDLCRIVSLANDITEEEAATLFARQVAESEERRSQKWQLETSHLDELGLHIRA